MTPASTRTGWRAALIGVSRYTHPAITDIRAAANNIHDLTRLFTAPTGAALRGEDCAALIDPDTPPQVGELLANAADQAEEVLVVYYAGHGLLDRRGRLHLALTGSDPDHPEWSSIPFAALRDELATARARARILILDCCFSGRAFEAMSAPATVVNGQIDINGTYTIASSPRNEPSLAPEGHRHTAFTDALLTAATSSIGLTLDQLYGDIDQILHRNGHPRPVRRSVNITGNLRLFTPPGYRTRSDNAVVPLVIDPLATPDSATEEVFASGQRAAKRGDLAEAENAWRTAALHGHPGAMNNLANLLCTQGKLRAAHPLYLDAAQRGNTAAMGNLADLLHRIHEDADAEYWWQRAAEGGDIDAMYNLALMLDKSRRFDEALTWYRHAAELGHTNAMHNLAIRLRYRGQLTEATTWWHRAGHNRPQRISEKLRGPAPHRQSR
ncbi:MULTISPECIES: tetratricopeptide repeat protein [unclassified Nocardia]|uniref:caspase, EACC1-associated type n=1 Tax=unclassified Nocardia TaxID=2637762 RepID=UPI001CE46610|nr:MULTISPECIES: tetratricopeptide repeat protein [unclassified Nocardia]